MKSFKQRKVNLFTDQYRIKRKSYWYLVSVSGQLKFIEFMSTLIALIAYYYFYFTTYEYVISDGRGEHIIKETNTILLTGFYCYKFSTFTIIIFTNITTVFDIFDVRETLKKQCIYYIECLLNTFSCIMSIFCGYLAVTAYVLLAEFKVYADFTLLIAATCSFIGAILFFSDFCRVFIKEMDRNELQAQL